MPYDPSFLPRAFLGCQARYESSGIVLFGAPFDGTTSFRPGARFAPSAMRGDSFGLETYSPYQDADLEDFAIHDAGDLDLPFGNTEAALGSVKTFVSKIYKDKKKPLLVGGEHLVSLPATEAALEAFPDLCVVQFDAHTDLRDEYLGQKLSHACVTRRLWDLLGDGRIWQFGVRSGTGEEFRWAGQGHVALHKFGADGIQSAVKNLRGRPVYLSVDLDVLDPSVLPGTGAPEAGGMGFDELIQALLSLKGLNIAAADITELSPHYDASGASTAAACKALREVALLLCG